MKFNTTRGGQLKLATVSQFRSKLVAQLWCLDRDEKLYGFGLKTFVFRTQRKSNSAGRNFGEFITNLPKFLPLRHCFPDWRPLAYRCIPNAPSTIWSKSV